MMLAPGSAIASADPLLLLCWGSKGGRAAMTQAAVKNDTVWLVLLMMYTEGSLRYTFLC